MTQPGGLVGYEVLDQVNCSPSAVAAARHSASPLSSLSAPHWPDSRFAGTAAVPYRPDGHTHDVEPVDAVTSPP